jgi:hypothetical protein
MKVYGYANNLKGEQIYGRLVDRKFLLVKDTTLVEIKPDTFQSEQEIRVKERNKLVAKANRKATSEIKKINKNKTKNLQELATPEMLGKYLAMIMLQWVRGNKIIEDEYTYEYEKEKALNSSEYKEILC